MFNVSRVICFKEYFKDVKVAEIIKEYLVRMSNRELMSKVMRYNTLDITTNYLNK